jgi:hypothetical protein
MSKIKKMAIALAAVTIMAGPSMGAQILCGGNVPLVNTMVGVSAMSLDFSGSGTDVEIASFIINNNSQSFNVSWNLTHDGNFYLNATNEIPFTKLTATEAVLGAWGAPGQTLPTDLVGNVAIAAASPTFLITGVVQTTATINEKIVLKASWADASAKLAGLYTEQIVYSIVVTL